MKKRNGMMALELLLGLLIITLLFLYFTGNLLPKNSSNTVTKNTTHTVTKEKIYRQIDDLQQQKQELINEQQRRMDNIRNNY